MKKGSLRSRPSKKNTAIALNKNNGGITGWTLLKARKPVIYMGKNIAQIKRFYKPNNIAMLKKPNISDVNRQFKGVKIMIFAKR
jgi:hypothetical protein